MAFLRRFLFVLWLALLTMQGAFAHQHAASSPHAGSMMAMEPHAGDVAIDADASAQTAHCADLSGSAAPCRHGHCSCCTTACGFHCCVLPGALRFGPQVTGSAPAKPFVESRHAGVTHPPLLRPPIA